MKLFPKIIAAILVLTSPMTISAELSIKNPYVRETPPHVKNSAAFMVIHNQNDKEIKLVKASSEIADKVELHTHIHEDGLMKMREVESIAISANSKATLQPGGFHVMFLGLKQPVKSGDTVSFTLHFDNGETIKIDAPAKKVKMNKKAKHSK